MVTFAVVGFAICIAIGVFLCHILNIRDHVRTTSITISVVMIVSVVNNDISPIMNAVLRFAESVIGALVAVAVALTGIYIYSLKKSEK